MKGRGAQNTSSAVMQQRREPPDGLDFFPTPPWATRALVECVLEPRGFGLGGLSVWEPACGEGHMASVLEDYASFVFASDVHDYGYENAVVGSFVGAGIDVTPSPALPGGIAWVITNPPFNLAEEFFARAFDEARGVALLVRTAWLESKERYERIFERHPPNLVALFSERVPMVKGRWDPSASTATSYAWVIWREGGMAPGTQLTWIPPGQRNRLTRADDVRRFAHLEAHP